MNKKKHTLILGTLFLSLTILSSLFVSRTSKIDFSSYVVGEQSSCIHEGYHYDGHENSLITNGNKEFWACCKCHSMFFSKPSGTWTDKSKYSYNLEDTEAFIPSTARDIGNMSSSSTVGGALEGYAFSNYYSFNGYAQFIFKENVNISRYQKVVFAVKSESLYFIIQDPTWQKPVAPGKWVQVVLDQTADKTWDVYIGDLGGLLTLHASSFAGTDLRAVSGLGSEVGNFYITNLLGYYKQTEISGQKVDEAVYSANGIKTYKTYENVPTGFEQVKVTETKTTSGSFFHGQFFSAVDLSSYSKVRFAMKTIGYFLLNHSWSSHIDGSNDWLIFELTKTATYTWDLVITNYNGETIYTESNLNGKIDTSPSVYTTNSLNAILCGNCSGFTPSKNNAYDLKVFVTEVRALNQIKIDNTYTIIYDGDDLNAWKASQDLFDVMGRVTSWTTYLVPEEASTESYSDSSKIISIGNTNFAKTAGVTVSDELNSCGFVVKNKGKSFIIVGKTGAGVTSGVRYFMEKALDYDCFAHTTTDTISIYKKVSTILIDPLSVEKEPTIAHRQITSSYDTLHGGLKMSLGYSYDNNGAGHLTSDVHTLSSQFLPYDTYKISHWRWYAKDGSDIQLCYSARGNSKEYEAMKTELFNEITPLISASDLKTCYIDLSIRDNWHQCTCSSCKSEISTYGSYGGQIIHFVSEVADLVDEWAKTNAPNKTIKYVFLAYQQAQTPPSSLSYTLNPNVIVYFGAPKADFSKGFTDSVNIDYYNQLVGWSTLLKNINYKNNLWFWAYDTQAMCYMMPFNSYEKSQDLIRLLSSLGVSSVHYETPYVSRLPSFEDLNVYIKGKLLNDCTLNFDDLVNKFMTNYYGPASSHMKTYYNQLKSIMQANVGGTIFSDANVKDYWSIDSIKTMLSTLDSCLQDTLSITDEDTRTAIQGRIHRERITPIFLLMEHYVNSYTYTKQTMIDLLNEMKTYAEQYNITYYNHNTELSPRLSSYTNSVNAL